MHPVPKYISIKMKVYKITKTVTIRLLLWGRYLHYPWNLYHNQKRLSTNWALYFCA